MKLFTQRCNEQQSVETSRVVSKISRHQSTLMCHWPLSFAKSKSLGNWSDPTRTKVPSRTSFFCSRLSSTGVVLLGPFPFCHSDALHNTTKKLCPHDAIQESWIRHSTFDYKMNTTEYSQRKILPSNFNHKMLPSIAMTRYYRVHFRPRNRYYWVFATVQDRPTMEISNNYKLPPLD